MEQKLLLPPDGGWSWAVCFAYIVNNGISLPLVFGLGLLFQETFTSFGITAMQTMIILNTNQVIMISFGMFTPRLLDKYGYRKIAAVGALLTSIGVLTTSVARTTISLIITYGVITGLGLSLTSMSFSLALDKYFNKKKNLANNIGLFFSGLGPIYMPHLTSFLYLYFGYKEAIMILAAVSMNSLAAALILRPIKWYLKSDESKSISQIWQNGTMKIRAVQNNQESFNNLLNEDKSTDEMTESDKDYLEDGSHFKISFGSLDDISDREISIGSNITSKSSLILNNAALNSKIQKRATAEVNLNSSFDLFDEIKSIKADNEFNENVANERIITKENIKSGEFLIITLSLAVAAEISFTVMLPFMLRDLVLDVVQIGIVLSVIFASEFLFKMTSPSIGEWCQKSAKAMYFNSLCMLVFTRTVFMLSTSYKFALVAGVGLGVTKGICSTFTNLVIPEQVPLEKIDLASVIERLSTSIFLIVLSPILGRMREVSGSYKSSMVLINVLTIITILLWILECVYMRAKSRLQKYTRNVC